MKKIELCHHVKDDGAACHSPALRGQGYCYFHVRYKGYPLRTLRNKHRLGGWRFPVRTALDLRAVEANLKRVELALACGSVDPESARLLRWALRSMVADLRRAQQENSGLD